MPRGARRRFDHDAARLGPTTPPLEQVLPLLLLDDHLTADSKLACFGTSRGMAEQLLRNATRTKLMLTLGGAASAARSSSSSSRSARTRLRGAQQLAAQSSNVALSLHGGLLTPAACLWQRITSIHLQGVQLSSLDVSSRSQLQLPKLPHLHTLSLQACHINAGPANQQRPVAASSVRTLQCVRCTPSSASLLRMVVSLVEPGQLQTLITDDYAATDLLAQLPGLQEVQLLPVAAQLGDSAFQQLLQHPGLTRVSLTDLCLEQDHSDRPCSWTSLVLVGGTDARCLAALPLANIQSCTVVGCLECDYSADQLDRAISNAKRCPRLVFEPTTRGCVWTPEEPTFNLFSGETPACSILALVMRHIAHGALMMCIRAMLPPAAVAALSAAPATLTTLGFILGADGGYWAEVAQAEAGLCTHLPAHIAHVMFYLGCEVSIEQWQRLLFRFMKGVTRTLKLTFLHCDRSHVWPAPTKQAVQEWLTTHASNQVQVDFQLGTALMN